MKKITLLTVTLLLTALVQLTAQPVQAEVSIPDENLAAAIRDALGLPAGAAITSDALRNLTQLYAGGRGIADLTGLEHAVNLTRLYIGGGSWEEDDKWGSQSPSYGFGNPISNLSTLASLKNLESLSLFNTAVSDVSALASLTQLEALNLGFTSVSDVSALASLTNLRFLSLTETGVSDVSALASLTNLEWLNLDSTGVSDVSALAHLTNLGALNLWNTGVSDVSALASLANLEQLNLIGSPLNAAAHQTHIPTIQANGTEVEFSPFKPIHLQRVPWLVSLIYFRPSDRPVRPNVDAEIDELIKKAQRFFADQLERHGFGRKTFQFETDAHGNAVVHHINGKFPNAHYQQNSDSWKHEIGEHIYIPRRSIIVRMLDSDPDGRSFTGAGGTGRGSPYGGGSANIDNWGWSTIAHELGHAFGMNTHDFRSDRYLMSYGSDEELSPCFAAWLDVHPAFNPTAVRSGTRATIQMLPATLAAPPNTIRLRFTVTAPAGSLYQARLLIPQKTELDGYDFNAGGLIDCKQIDGNPTSSTVEFVTALTPDTESVSLQIIGIDGGRSDSESFPIDVASLTEAAPQLVADMNGDGIVNIQDLVLVAGQFGKTGKNSADVNGDGVVNIQDLVLVAGALR